MRFCPECGNELSERTVDGGAVRLACDCGFVDWDNWVYPGVGVVARDDQGRFAMVRMKGALAGKLSFPSGYRDLGETLEEAAAREFGEETGHAVHDLELFRVYTRDDKRILWVVYEGRLGAGCFRENPETSEMLLFSPELPPPDAELRGPLTRRLLDEFMDGGVDCRDSEE